MAKGFWKSENLDDVDPAATNLNVVFPKPRPTYEQIVARAKKIWEDKGCPVGRDEENWIEAETQLQEEMLER